MKKNIAVLMIMILLLFATGCVAENVPQDGYLRIHIRANSDLPCDQEVKLAVRDSIVGYLSPLLKGAKSAKQAEKIIISHLSDIQTAVDELLYSCGYFYGCDAEVKTEYFEERTYGDLTLPAGSYRAVIVNLGTGKGKNWWCVAFPPMCFTSEDYDNVNYKSILAEVVKKYLNKGEK